MNDSMPLSDQLALTTLRLECRKPGGKVSVGTGFLYDFKSTREKSTIPVIVTNWHVMENAESLKCSFHASGKDGSYTRGSSQSFEAHHPLAATIRHPNLTVDLCVVAAGPMFRHLSSMGATVKNRRLSFELIPTPQEWEGFAAVEDILMIGYPDGIWDQRNNQPIARRGITATHPGLTYEGRAEFLIDAACFHGSSGSPVFLYNVGTYSVGRNVNFGARVKFLGILYSGPSKQTIGRIQVAQLGLEPVAVMQTMLNLGTVIRSTELAAFEPILQAKEKTDAARSDPPSSAVDKESIK